MMKQYISHNLYYLQKHKMAMDLMQNQRQVGVTHE